MGTMKPGRAIWGALAVAAVAATAARLPLLWDGSVYLANILESGAPNVPHNRWPVGALHLVVIAARPIGVEAASFVFAALYAAVPALAFALAWVWHRDRPVALAWSAIGITGTVLSAQAFMVSEMVIAVQLWWPLLVLATGGWDDRRKGAWVTTAVVALLHPVAAVLLLILAVAHGLRRRWTSAAIVASAGVLRWSMLTGYESETASSSLTDLLAFGSPVRTAGMWLIVAGVAGIALTRRPAVPAAAIGTGGLILAVASGSEWQIVAGLVARSSVVTVVACVAAVALVHLHRDRDGHGVVGAAYGLAAIHATVVVTTATTWGMAVDREPALASGQCITADDPDRPMLRHWSVTALDAVLDGQPAPCQDPMRAISNRVKVVTVDAADENWPYSSM